MVSTGGIADKSQLFYLLTDSGAVEWRDKVGVVGAVDGSAKTTTRLIVSDGWVLKTSTALASPSKSELFDRVSEVARNGSQARLWHPDKCWGIYRHDDEWYPVNATPLMDTLRKAAGQDKKMQGWTAMFELAVEVSLRSSLGLDLNPSNFGRLPGDDRLYYLDDEWYAELRFAELGSAIVARIPEEPDIDANEWKSWGRVLAGVFEPLCKTSDDWAALYENVETHPTASQFETKRKALVKGLRHADAMRRFSRKEDKQESIRKSTQLTAVIADVHGNSEALDAVLAKCKELSVDNFIFVGDAVGYGPDPKGCIQRLAELPNTRYVRGNHDHTIGTGLLKDGMNGLARSCASWTLEQLSAEDREWLVSMPIDAHGRDWLAVHGAPKDPRRFLAYVYELTYEDNLENLADRDLQLCFCGHTHVQFIHQKTALGAYEKLGTPKRFKREVDQILIVNPGSVGQPRDRDNRAAFAIWDRKEDVIGLQRVSYSVSAVVEKIKSLGLPSGLGDRLLQGT